MTGFRCKGALIYVGSRWTGLSRNGGECPGHCVDCGRGADNPADRPCREQRNAPSDARFVYNQPTAYGKVTEKQPEPRPVFEAKKPILYSPEERALLSVPRASGSGYPAVPGFARRRRRNTQSVKPAAASVIDIGSGALDNAAASSPVNAPS